MRLHVATCKDDHRRRLTYGFLQNRSELRTAPRFRVACATDGARRPFCQRRPYSGDACEDNKPKHQSTKVALPKDYVFGRNLGIDVLGVEDTADEPYQCLSILDLRTTFQQVVLLRQGQRVAIKLRVLGQLC